MRSKLILLIVSVVLAIVLAEVVIRATGRYQTYTERTGTGGYVSPFHAGFGDGFESEKHLSWYRIHTPHEKIEYSNNEFAASWIANNEGLNDTDFSTNKKGIRVMVLGDSFTDGCGSTNDSSYPQLLAGIIRDSVPGPSEVWNCGVGGSDILFEFMLLRDRLLKYKPDMVVVTINNTDIQETIIRGGFERFDKDGTTHYRKGPWFEPLFARSYLVRSIVFDVFHYNWQFTRRGEEQQARDEATAHLNIAIDSFEALGKLNGIKVIFAFHPMLTEVQNKNPYATVPLISQCQAKGYDYVDTRQQFYEMGIDTANASSLYWPIDGHFNNRGYSYLAKGVWTKASPLLRKASQ